MTHTADKSATISPTAHFTAQVWLRNGLSDKRLHTRQGELMYRALLPLKFAARAVGGPTLDDFLLARHELIDLRLRDAIDSGRVSQVIEIAAGLSPRGLRFAKRYGSRITYVEADLPGMVARKRQLLGRLDSGHHRLVTLDALSDAGPDSLAALAGTLDPSQGVAIVTEGLLNYFDRDSVSGMWSRFARALAGFPQGIHLADIHVRGGNSGLAADTFRLLLSTFVRGRVHLHFRTPRDVERELVACGFDTAKAHDPHDFAANLASCKTKWASLVRVIEASRGC